MKRFSLILVLLFTVFTLFACGDTTVPTVDGKLDITNVTLSNKEVTYDGNEHSIEIVGTLPTGVSVSYTNNNKSAVGVYQVTATLTGTAYNTKVLTATLTIANRTITGITFTNLTVDHDGNMHKIEISGNLPAGVTAVYSSDVTSVTNEASAEGIYNVTATLSGTGYATLTLTAILTIRPYGEEVFTGITFINKTVVHDGSSHTIAITGTLPAGATVVYTSTTQSVTNTATNVGVYNVTATITKAGYQTLTLQAVLTISASQTLQFEGITFDNYSIEFDSFEHEIVVEGVLPSGTSVVYTSDVSGVTNKATEAGVYNVTATLTKTGYQTLVLNARLTIKAVDKERFIFVDGSNIYYNNGLDNENLYVNNVDGNTKINNDEARFIIKHNGVMYYVANGLISTSIKSFSGTTAQTVYSASAQFLISDGTSLYYAVNPLFGESGIYKLNIDAEEPVVTKVFTGKAKYLNIIDNDIYFANGNDSYKLYKIGKNSLNGTATLVLDEKIKELTYFNGSLYFTVNNLLGDYLARFIISSSTTVKLTSDNAKYLTIAGGYVYYSNVDLINTQIYGKGLYRVPVNALVNNNGAGELVYQTEYNVSSLYAKDDQTILFYRLSDKHLLSINTQTKVVTDLLDGFTSPTVESPQLLSKFETFVWEDRVYYINNYVDGALFYYDTKSNQSIRVTASGVKSFSISGDYLYFNQISWLINNDIYMINLRQGGIPEKISSNDGRDMVVHSGYLYYVRENAFGVGTAITRLSLDGSFTEVDVYAFNSHNLTVHDGKLYFIKGAGVDEIWRADILANGDLANITRLGTDKTDWFVLVGDSMYYRFVGTFSKNLSKMNLDGTNKVVVISGYDPISFIIRDGYIYFTNDTLISPKDGIYKANLDGTNIQLLFENTNNDGFGIEMQIVGNYLYYYSKSGLLGDYKMHRLNLTTLVSEIIQ